MSRLARIVLLAAGLGLGGLAPACAPAGRPGGDRLTIGAYSVVREAFHEAILPAFAEHWRRETGREVRFEESYNASGAQSRAIASGFDADIAVLSLQGDIDRLVKAGLVRADWDAGPDRGLITRSLVVIGHRPGNPEGIRGWDDLARPGLGVLYPDPMTSGGARWNINAIYGAGLFRESRSTPDPEGARALLAGVQANVVTLDSSGRQSVNTFLRGSGDAIVTYENELRLLEKSAGAEVPYVIPEATLLIEGPAVVVDASVDRHGNRELAEAFLAFLRSEPSQRIFVEYGFRPLDPALEAGSGLAPLPPRLFTMADLGGWTEVNKEVYGPGGVWDSLFTGSKPGGAPR